MSCLNMKQDGQKDITPNSRLVNEIMSSANDDPVTLTNGLASSELKHANLSSQPIQSIISTQPIISVLLTVHRLINLKV